MQRSCPETLEVLADQAPSPSFPIDSNHRPSSRCRSPQSRDSRRFFLFGYPSLLDHYDERIALLVYLMHERCMMLLGEAAEVLTINRVLSDVLSTRIFR